VEDGLARWTSTRTNVRDSRVIWRNHFTDRVRQSFQDRYGQLLVDAGYERDLVW
jgi:hypothetical protein